MTDGGPYLTVAELEQLLPVSGVGDPGAAEVPLRLFSGLGRRT